MNTNIIFFVIIGIIFVGLLLYALISPFVGIHSMIPLEEKRQLIAKRKENKF